MARLVFIGLSITSSWGNGHATTYRALIKALAARGHDIVFLEQDRPRYADHRDLARPPYCKTYLYADPRELYLRHRTTVQNADAVIIGSFVAHGALLFDVARVRPQDHFVVAGAQYTDAAWPSNVQHIAHLAPSDHAAFYCAQSLALNITRAEMRKAGYSPSVRLFEAAACGVPIVPDRRPGLPEFFEPGVEIFRAENTNDILEILSLPKDARDRVARAARARVLSRHTSNHRAVALEQLLCIAPSHARAKARADVAGGTGDIAVR